MEASDGQNTLHNHCYVLGWFTATQPTFAGPFTVRSMSIKAVLFEREVRDWLPRRSSHADSPSRQQSPWPLFWATDWILIHGCFECYCGVVGVAMYVCPRAIGVEQCFCLMTQAKRPRSMSRPSHLGVPRRKVSRDEQLFIPYSSASQGFALPSNWCAWILRSEPIVPISRTLPLVFIARGPNGFDT